MPTKNYPTEITETIGKIIIPKIPSWSVITIIKKSNGTYDISADQSVLDSIDGIGWV